MSLYARKAMLVLLGLAALVLVSAPGAASGAAGWSPTESMAHARASATATLLDNGRVLVAGGSDETGPLDSAELYDLATGSWSSAGTMAHAHTGHTATLLDDGRVLVVGGGSGAELYDPATNNWAPAAEPPDAMEVGSAILMTFEFVDHDQVFVTGRTPDLRPQTAVYDPPTDAWGLLAPMTDGHGGAVSVLVPGAADPYRHPDVLVAGWSGGLTPYERNAELYQPWREAWQDASLPQSASWFTLTPLPNGDALEVGGYLHASFSSSAAYLYHPDAHHGEGVGSWSAMADMHLVRNRHTATLLGNGKVLVAGGQGGPNSVAEDALASTELFDPLSEGWSLGPSMSTPRFAHTATLLRDGRVLVAGGRAIPYYLPAPSLAGAELYTAPTSLSVAAVHFGTQTIGTPSPIAYARVENIGNSPLFVTSATPSGAAAADITVVSDGCSHAAIAPDDACLVGLRFTPHSGGDIDAALTLLDNTHSGTTVVPVTGAGSAAPATVAPEAAPEPLHATMTVPTQRLGTALKRGLKLTLRADYPGQAAITVKLDARLAKKLGQKKPAAKKSVRMRAANKSLTLTVPLRGLSTRVKRALARRKTVKFTVAFRCTSDDYRTALLTRTITLRR